MLYVLRFENKNIFIFINVYYYNNTDANIKVGTALSALNIINNNSDTYNYYCFIN